MRPLWLYFCDGTALYEAAAAIFTGQVYAGANSDFAFGFTKQVTIAITATLAAVGLPATYLPLILPVDWLLDRFRTATNAFGDSVGSAVVDQSFPDESAAQT